MIDSLLHNRGFMCWHLQCNEQRTSQTSKPAEVAKSNVGRTIHSLSTKWFLAYHFTRFPLASPCNVDMTCIGKSMHSCILHIRTIWSLNSQLNGCSCMKRIAGGGGLTVRLDTALATGSPTNFSRAACITPKETCQCTVYRSRCLVYASRRCVLRTLMSSKANEINHPTVTPKPLWGAFNNIPKPALCSNSFQN